MAKDESDPRLLGYGNGDTGDVLPPDDPGDDGEPGGSCWSGCGRGAMEGQRLCETCAQHACATCGGYGIVSWIDGAAFVSGACPACAESPASQETL